MAIAGIMLEAIGDDTLRGNDQPKAYVETGATATRSLPVCEDSDGRVFRETSWSERVCVSICPDGVSGDCASSASGVEHCYRETSFSFNQRDIEAGKMLNASGFARGNFNYRIGTIGVNIVGTGVRNCADSATPTACYGAGYATYSLAHIGPYYVRNALGQDYEAQLFTGNIEHARALATERYITNPVSSSDSALLASYLRSEFRGRPLDGHFVLRMWEEEGVDFSQIEDVQIVLNYRYWTAFN